MYKLIKNNGTARLGEFETVHGTVKTPGFMNVATCAAIKADFQHLTLRISIVRLCFATHITFMYVPVMMLFMKWADCINLQVGTDLY